MKFNLLVNWKLKTSFLTIALLIGLSSLQAQTVTVKGNVTGDGMPLPGVGILVKGTAKGASTDFDGNYEVKAKSTDVLVFSYIGFAAQEIKIGGRTTINVVLKSDVAALEEVVVVGYGTQRKKEVTGAVVKVKSEDLQKTTTSDIGTALQGQIAGVNVASSSGAPGEEANILIRGFSSLMDGQSGPLYVVDGIPFDSDPQLSISEIESIDVLKDAASASIYGTRGAGGVILITTKQGKVGQMKISVESEYGIQRITSDFDQMSKEEYTYLHMLRGAINTDKPQGGVESDITRNASYFTNNTNIGDVLLNDNAPIQNHRINITGGKEGLTYNFNANYFQQEGSFYNSDYKRFNVRANTMFVKGKWKIKTALTFKRDDQLKPWTGMMNRIYEYQAFKPAINLDDNVLENISEISTDDPTNDWKLNEARSLANSLRTIKTTDERAGNSHAGNISLDFDVNDDLRLTGRFGIQYDDKKWVKKIPRYDIYNTEGDLITNPANITSQTITDITSQKFTSEVFANYNKTFGLHTINALVMTSFEESKQERYSLEVRNNLNPAITVLDNYELLWDIESGGYDFTKTLIGNLARIQYNYDGKYLLSASARYDGSSQFGKDNRWGLFPSVSVGWNVSDETFWEPVKDVINSLKIRASYGTTGNDRFNPYSNQSVVEPGVDYVFGSNSASDDLNNAGSETGALGTIQQEFANADLKWETNIEQNIGFDLGLFKNKLTFSADFYKNEKEDLLYQIVNPPSTGVSGSYRSTVFNVGNMENKGMELGFNYRHKVNKDFRWSIAGTFTKNENEVTKTAENNPIIYLDNGYLSTKGSKEIVTVITEGYEAAAYFLRETAGVIKTEEQLIAYQNIDPSAKMGELMYVDQLTEDTDGDGIADAGNGAIDDGDRIYQGSGSPDFETGINISANYKDFDFSMQWYGSFGAEIMNGSKAYAYQAGVHKDLFYSWTEHNQNSDIPWYDGNGTRSYRGASDYFLENGDFVRLRNVSLGYTLPKTSSEKLGLSKLRIYIQAQNLLTITDYTGFDPEVGGNGLSTRGIDQGRYPISSQVKAGIQLQF
ncbi:TonB-linked outer membrane protein, SusC/RagA family [Lutibacter oricola]|uniref:TonB-linked outer membrane protein, SusC/RagA family n=1 Tax=Lutibacter oricola TaxID=762486 RepID=A0A1H3FHF9_9FLAO|nr:TonB-dependent receptor [Lutibacter oricola]SDX90451.1 TonB-linked outer membrane protein, SusC/RagA family [Lutibacter oricola]